VPFGVTPVWLLGSGYLTEARGWESESGVRLSLPSTVNQGTTPSEGNAPTVRTSLL